MNRLLKAMKRFLSFFGIPLEMCDEGKEIAFQKVKTDSQKPSTILEDDLVSDMDIEQVFQKHVVDGSSYYFVEILKAENLEYELRHELSQALRISINDVVIVGSAKLGYSLKSDKFREFDYAYRASNNPRKKSDIDIAIVNRRFYDETMEQIYHLSRHFDNAWIQENWKINLFRRILGDDPLHISYSMYIAKGWMRPDFLPNAFLEVASWKPVCEKWYSKLGKRKLSVGIYSDWVYLKHYQMDNLDRLRNQLVNKLEKMK